MLMISPQATFCSKLSRLLLSPHSGVADELLRKPKADDREEAKPRSDAEQLLGIESNPVVPRWFLAAITFYAGFFRRK